MAISPISFSNTPQAKDDAYLKTEDNYLGQICIFDVMANELGGNAKSLYSIDNGLNDDAVLGADLLIRDVAGVGDYSRNGATIKLTANGMVSYDPSTFSAALEAQFQALAVGQELSDTFTYAIRLGNGTLSWATVTVKISGLNDGPTITSGAQHGGYLGVFSLAAVNQADDSVGWNFQVQDSAIDYLAAGQQLIQKYNVSVSDGNGDTLVYGIAGGTVALGVSTLVGTYGTLTVDTVTGAYRTRMEIDRTSGRGANTRANGVWQTSSERSRLTRALPSRHLPCPASAPARPHWTS